MSADLFGDLDLGALGPEGERLVIIMLVVYLCALVVLMLYSTVMYVLQSIGMYTIAKRRCIHHAWLAWIPIAANWLCGSISDQYQFVAKGKVRNRRKVLLGLSIPTFVLSMVNMVFFAFNVIAARNGSADALIPLCILMVSMIMSILSIVLSVFQYIALYDLFASCVPKNAVLFLILHLLFGLGAIFIFAVRKKDEGMPPRRIQVPVAPWMPATAPVAPVLQQPVMPQTAWQPPVAEETPAVDTPAEEAPAQPEETND